MARARPNQFTKLLARILSPAAEAVTVADHEGYILEANDAVEQVYRRPVHEILRQHPLAFCPDTEEWKQLSETIFNSINSTGQWDGVVMNKNSKGEFSILLRTRLIEFQKKKYVISWARPFPHEAPFGLAAKQAECFSLLGQGCTTKEIAARISIKPSTVTEHLKRIWKRSKVKVAYSAPAIKHLAIRCHEAGWDSRMKINKEWKKAH